MSKIILNFARNTVLLTISKIFYFIMGLILNALITRNFGAEIYGTFTLVYSSISFFTIFVVLGNRNGLMYFIPRYIADGETNRKKDLISTSLILSSLIGLVVVLFVFLLSNNISLFLFNSVEFSLLIRFVSLIIYIDSLIEICKVSLRSNELIKYFALGDILLIASRIILLLFLIEIDTNVYLISAAYLGASILATTYYFFILYKNKLFGNVNRNSIYDYIAMTKAFIPAMFNAIINLIQHRIDKLMIGIFINASAVGIYNIAISIANMSSFLFNIVNIVIAPIISRLYYEKKIDDLGSLFKKATFMSSLFNLLFFSMIVIFKREILLIFGKEFIDGTLVLILVTLGQVVNSVTGPVASIIAMIGKSKVLLVINTLSMIINALLNYWTIPLYGIEGAAFSTMIALSISNISYLIFVFYELKIHPFSKELFIEISIITTSLLLSMLIRNYVGLDGRMELLFVTILFVTMFTVLNVVSGFYKEFYRFSKELLKR